MQKQSIITGLWKFLERVPEQQLVDLAMEWSKDERYLQLYIRKASKNQNAIGFMYDIKDTTDFDAFFDEVSDKLKRQFGNDLVGWDISQKTIIIK